ncbi:MAG: energy-coupling factor transporter transmembrane protein EcfT [candidate division Zixibacteria bacterium]|nr:energy-coupling factor transporter transmembrane protein EcfT [candidate division Zixibacteria bacterium]
MDLAYLDYLATGGNSFFHRTSPGLKLIFSLLLIGIIILVKEVLFLVIILLFLYLIILLSKLPFHRIFLLSLFPLIFTLIFAYASLGRGWEWFFIILLRVLGTATTMIILFSTTPFPCIFASLGKIFPEFIITVLFMTYRSVFILFSVFDDIRSGFKLRGGFQLKHPKRSLFNLARAFGYLLLKGIDDSQRFYENLRIRGFQGKIVHHRRFCTWIKKQ